MNSEGAEINSRSVLALVTNSSGEPKEKNTRERLLFRTLAGPANLPEVIYKLEELNAIKHTLPEQMQDVADNIYERQIRALVATTSVKGGMLQMLTTQKTEFKVNNPALRRTIIPRMGGDGGGGGGGQM